MSRTGFPGHGMREDASTFTSAADEAEWRAADRLGRQRSGEDLDISQDMEREFPNRKETTMAMTEPVFDPRMPGKVANVGVVKETPFTRLSGAVERLRKAETLANEVCTKLCGEQMPGEDSAARSDHPTDLLGVVDSLADDVTFLADSIIEHAQRLNRRL